ncbi:NADH-quinone oxidoreductase subunit C [Limibaculum sp. M0105]|uniref:NADH-quinone oxidoreductase subunit C n=1 Tax=Thermohalobaculum xanthum TaxID=2753746 RepID=A0A8J7M409_9RHOB|nr:NADH-quinone oxidoreductase subunit C [Thermohalobaculum xanthum]MBK0397773.1 NADH-quinone oxidoreductase subunit C [Thermohalobaculum xanthum]
MASALEELGEMIAIAQADAVVAHSVAHGELTLESTASGLRTLIGYLRDNPACAFTTLIDITGVDWPGRERRFDVVYHFLSMPQNQRVRVKVVAGEDDVIPSINDLHPSANWFEREVFDMFGVMFSGHPDLRRILTDYGFRGYPLRKDFPTTGYVEVRYDETQKRVVYEPVKLVQEYRQFDFMSPWEGAEYILPGDEKNRGT